MLLLQTWDGSAGSSELNPLLPQQVTLGMSATEDQETMAADEDLEPGSTTNTREQQWFHRLSEPAGEGRRD